MKNRGKKKILATVFLILYRTDKLSAAEHRQLLNLPKALKDSNCDVPLPIGLHNYRICTELF
jgi:hypothetical protein